MNQPTVDADSFRKAMAACPTGVMVVTSFGPEGPSGMTANAVASLSLDPLLMLVCFEESARTLRSVRHSGAYGVNVLATGQEEVARTFASKMPEPEKWERIEWEQRGGVPLLDGAVAWIECEVKDLIDGGDHLIAIGSVLDVMTSDREPLVFHKGEYKNLAG